MVRYEAAYDALSRAAHAHLVRGHHDAQRAALLECAAAFDCARDGAGGGGGGDADAEPTRDKLRRLDAARAERRGGGGAKRARAEAAEVAAEG